MGVISFTEEHLGVNTVYESCKAALVQRAELCSELDTKRREYGRQKQAISERELEIINEQAGVEHGSATARKEAIKDAIAADADMRTKRAYLDELRADLDSIEDDLKGCDAAIHADTARMEELGGLLHLYAATKQAGG